MVDVECITIECIDISSAAIGCIAYANKQGLGYVTIHSEKEASWVKCYMIVYI